MTKPILTGQHI